MFLAEYSVDGQKANFIVTMIGWAILYALLTFIIFITGLIGGASVLMGTINKDRGWVVFGLKALLITVLTFCLVCVLAWPYIKGPGLHIKSILTALLSILK